MSKTADTAWTGIGAFVVGIGVLQDHVDAMRILSAAPIVGELILMTPAPVR
jgi:quaternary ammonium compound-resistance protein SugE